MRDERIEGRSVLCFKDFGYRNRVQRVGSEAVNRFGRQRDNLAPAQQFNRRSAVG